MTEKLTLDEWGNRIFTKRYTVLSFNYDIGKTWVLDTTNGLIYAVIYADGYIRVDEEKYTIAW